MHNGDIMQRPRISVIIPTLNEEAYLAATLEAIARQTTQPHETIVVDGKSTDRTRDVAEKFGARFVETGRCGPARGRNEGARISSGDILLFIDADTILPPAFIGRTAEAFENDGISSLTAQFTCHDGDMLDRMLYKTANSIVWMIKHSVGFLHHPGFCCAFRRELFFKIGGFPEHIPHGEDIFISLAAGAAGKSKFMNTTILTSARRLKAEGRLKIPAFYAANILSFIMLRKVVGTYCYGMYNGKPGQALHAALKV